VARFSWFAGPRPAHGEATGSVREPGVSSRGFVCGLLAFARDELRLLRSSAIA
jgi:hypothetical protein